MKKREHLAYVAVIVVAIVFLCAEFSSAMPTTATISIVGDGVIDRTIDIRSAKGSYGLVYQSDMRTPSLGYYGISQVDFFEKIAFGEGNETHIAIDGKYTLGNVYRLTDVKNYDVGTRYKLVHSGIEEGSNNFYVSTNKSYMFVDKKVSGEGCWYILRKNVTGSVYRDKGDYQGYFTIIMKDGEEEMRYVRSGDLGDWLECP